MALKIYVSGRPRVIQAVQLDMVESEDHGLNLELTEVPIEDGSAVNDHAIFEPRELRITVWASKAPGTAVPALPTRHLKAWQRFKQLWESLTFLDVFTDLEPHKRMLITNVSTVRRLETTNAMGYTVTLRKPVFTDVDLTDNLADTVSDSGTGEDDLGTQGTADL